MRTDLILRQATRLSVTSGARYVCFDWELRELGSQNVSCLKWQTTIGESAFRCSDRTRALGQASMHCLVQHDVNR